ncbi:conjugal transfer protein TraP [Escherichia coli]|nr:conjugal transfer protein TraP [Escherichia coli]
MANNMSSRQACHAARYVVARVLRGLFWCLKYIVILPLATMALMALFVLWKDNTTPGKLLVKEINFVRQTAPAGQFPVSECWFSSSDSSGRSEIQDICHYRAADAADYVRETGRSCDDGADRWSGVVCRKIITPFLARGFFPGILRLSSGCAGRSGAVTGVVSLTARG